MKVILFEEYGEVAALQVQSRQKPIPSAGQVLIRLTFAGVNFIDIYHRRGLYPVALPFVPGQEGVGYVADLGQGVSTVAIGDRVAFTGISGSYAEFITVPADRLIKLPADLSFEDGAALTLQGLTMHYLIDGAFHLQSHHSCLIYAAAGGVGRLLVQAAKMKGAKVLAVVSSQEKAEAVRGLGADLVILSPGEKISQAVLSFTDGVGVDVVYDSVGRDTFHESLNSLRVRGLLVSYGQSSGPIPSIEVSCLVTGSYFLTRPTLGHYISDGENLQRRSQEIFDWARSGAIRSLIYKILPLSEAAQAHLLLEGRTSQGKILLRIDH